MWNWNSCEISKHEKSEWVREREMGIESVDKNVWNSFEQQVEHTRTFNGKQNIYIKQ